VIDVLALNDVCLLHGLDGILVLRLPLDPAHADITEGAYAHRLVSKPAGVNDI
jgi:hypothetical protein